MILLMSLSCLRTLRYAVNCRVAVATHHAGIASLSNLYCLVSSSKYSYYYLTCRRKRIIINTRMLIFFCWQRSVLFPCCFSFSTLSSSIKDPVLLQSTLVLLRVPLLLYIGFLVLLQLTQFPSSGLRRCPLALFSCYK